MNVILQIKLNAYHDIIVYAGTYLTNGRDLISEFLLFKAKDISQGPIQRIKLPVFMSIGLHGKCINIESSIKYI